MGGMTRQELIHLHTLFAEVSGFADEFDDSNVETPEYDALNIKPIAVHRSRDDHEEAVLTLAKEVSQSLETETIAQTVN